MSDKPAPLSKIFANRFLLLLLIHSGFVLIGATTTLLGVVLPALSGRLNLNDAQSGTLFTVQFAGSLLGTLLAGFLWKRFGFSIVLSAGLAAMSVAVLGLGWSGWRTAALCVFLNGVGIGLTIPTSNLLIARLNPERRAAALNILNFAWGGGALLSPTFFGLLGTQQDIRLPVGFLSLALLLTAFCFLLFSSAPLASADSDISTATDEPKIWRAPFAVLTAVLLFIYVGTESSLGGWISAYTLRLETADTTLWTPTVSAFWASFLLGRLLAPLGLRRVGASVYVLFWLFAAAFGMILLLLSEQIIFVTVAVIFVGFGLAPVFPTVLAKFTERAGEKSVRAANWLFISGTVGGASLTWLVGFVSNAFESLRSGFFIILFACLLMCSLQAYLYFEDRGKR